MGSQERMFGAPEAAQGDVPSAQPWVINTDWLSLPKPHHGLNRPSLLFLAMHEPPEPLQQRQSQKRKGPQTLNSFVFLSLFPQSECHMILQTLAWKLQKWQGSSPSPFSSSTFLFFLFPSAAATCSASTSASFQKNRIISLFTTFHVCPSLQNKLSKLSSGTRSPLPANELRSSPFALGPAFEAPGLLPQSLNTVYTFPPLREMPLLTLSPQSRRPST